MNTSRRPSKERRHCSLFPIDITAITQQTIQHAAAQRGLEDRAILALWSRATGDMLAPHTMPVRIIRSTRDIEKGDVLVVKVTPAYATLLMHQTEMILQRLHEMLGYRPAQRIKIQR